MEAWEVQRGMDGVGRWATAIIAGLLGRGGEAEACLLASWKLWPGPFCLSEFRARSRGTAG